MVTLAFNIIKQNQVPIIINLFKGKGDAVEHDNFKGLELLEHLLEHLFEKVIEKKHQRCG